MELQQLRQVLRRSACIIALIIVNVLFVFTMWYFHCELQGNDIYGHIFRIQSLVDAWDKGNLFPYYTPLWYNTVELFRYWPPLPYYFCAVLLKLVGNITSMYFCFILAVNLTASFGWLLFGFYKSRDKLGLILACLWLFLPDNMRILFSEGNLPRLFIGSLIPWLILITMKFYETIQLRWLIAIALISVMLVMSHVMITAMIGASVFLFGFMYACCKKNWKQFFMILYALGSGILSAGVILLPSLVGGITTQTSEASSATSADWSQSFFQSFNPATWYNASHIYYYYYFGLSLLLITFAGIIVMHRNTAPMFGTALAIFLGTSLSASVIISYLPMSQLFWMTRLIPIAEAFIFTGLLYWKELKRPIIWSLVLLILLDCFLSARVFAVHRDNDAQISREMEEDYLLREACESADNRFAFMDLSETNSYPSYIAVKYHKPFLFGWAYQGAATIKEIVFLNEAFEHGHYIYVFDRLVEYGCDTVSVPKEKMTFPEKDLISAAKRNGYDLLRKNEKAYLFKLSGVNSTYGTINEYKNVCIGEGSEYISFLYPSFYKLKENRLDKYTFEDLAGYEKIFISGPDYENKEYCEYLIKKLSEAGIKIYIDMSNLKTDRSTGRSSFLGAVAHPVTFTDSFPVLTKENGSQFKLDPEKQGFDMWTTAYFTALPNSNTREAMYAKNKGLSYLGYSDNGNIVFLGLNLVFYCASAPGDSTDLRSLLDEIFEVDAYSTCKRTLVPIEISYLPKKIIIKCPAGNVNTSTAILSGMDVDAPETFINGSKGTLDIKIDYAYLKPGIIISIIGILMAIAGIAAWYIIRERIYHEKDN